MKGWYGNRQRHRLASKGVLTTQEYRGYDFSQLGRKLSVREKAKKGLNAEQTIMNLIREYGYDVEDVSKKNKGLGDALVTIQSSCGECISLVEIKDVEELFISSYDRKGYVDGRPAIRVTGHNALLKNAEEMNAIPIYVFKINRDLGEGLVISKYFWKEAEYFTPRVDRMTGIYAYPTIAELEEHAYPIEDFSFFLQECEREMCYE